MVRFEFSGFTLRLSRVSIRLQCLIPLTNGRMVSAMARTAQNTTNSPLRKIGVGALIVIGAIALAFAMMALWSRALLFNTDTWVDTISPLPKDSAVSQALGTYATDQIFASVNVEAQIASVLPPRAAFVAGPLATQLQQKTQQLTTDFVASDQFQSIWTSANRLAHERLVKFIDRGPNQEPSVNVDLNGLIDQARAVADKTGIAVPPALAQQSGQIQLVKDNQWRDVRLYLRQVHNSPAFLPAFAAALLLGGIALSRNRRRTLVVTGLTVSVTAAAGLIALKLGRNEILDQAANDLNRNALGVIWDQMTTALHGSYVWTIVVSLMVSIVAALCAPAKWSTRLVRKLGLSNLSKGAVARTITTIRNFVRQVIKWILGLGVVVTLAILIAANTLTVYAVATALMWLIAYACAVVIIASRPARA